VLHRRVVARPTKLGNPHQPRGFHIPCKGPTQIHGASLPDAVWVAVRRTADLTQVNDILLLDSSISDSLSLVSLVRT
jgi:hypothetical protein